PSEIGFFPTVEWASAFAADGGNGYLVAGATLHVLDVTAPPSPRELGALTIPGERLFGVAAAGGLAVLAGSSATLYAIGVANPVAPVLQGTLAGGPAYDVALVGDRAVLAAGEAGVVVADVSAPAAPRKEAWYDTSGVAAALATSGNSVFVAT